jgi:hypothetical protein
MRLVLDRRPRCCNCAKLRRRIVFAKPARNGLAEDLFEPASGLFRDVMRIAFFDAFLQPGAVRMRDVL